MSLLSTFGKLRKRADDSAPQTDAAADSHMADWRSSSSHIGGSYDAELDDNIFNLLPPETAAPAAAEPVPEFVFEPLFRPKPQGSNHHPVDMTDLSRLSIDHDGRLYWDGKPVETHHRFAMSRRQIVGASLVAAFVAISAIGAAVQGAAAARDWACWFGWSAGACTLPGGVPRNHSNIPT
jgi:hypothetical protein